MIESQALSDELDSTFYLKNEAFCLGFEQLILEMGGETIGNYNSWSYNVKGKVNRNYRWIFHLKKATYSSGNLLLSSAYQNLLISSFWKCKNLESNLPNFLIRKRKSLDRIRLFFNRNLNPFSLNHTYLIHSKQIDHPLVNALYPLLADLFSFKKIYQISYQNSELIIELRTDSIHTNYIKQLAEMKFLVILDS